MLSHGELTHSANLLSPTRLTDLFSKILLLATVICVFVPFSPVMPGAGLDNSWVLGMNQAVAQDASLGTDIIFTFGPYSSIYTKSYHPSTDAMMLWGSMYLAFSYWLCVVFLTNHLQWPWIIALGIVLAGVVYLRDALLFSQVLLVALVSYKTILGGRASIIRNRWAIFLGMLFASLGLLPLIKGSLLILCGAIAALCFMFFVLKKEPILAAVCLISPIASMLLFWAVSGQPISSLPIYLFSTFEIISGYSEAMSTYGNVNEIVLYLAASTFLFATIFSTKSVAKISKFFLLCAFFLFLFLSFKAGFVRHDGHAIISAASLLVSAVLLCLIAETKLRIPLLVSAAVACFYISSNYISIGPAGIYYRLKSTYTLAWNGLNRRIEENSWPRSDYDIAMRALQGQANFPVLQGTTDIYSYNQSFLIASGNNWSPRPVFQSYSAYTPALAEKNRNHLLGGRAPDNVIFRAEPIDGRLPSIEDGASWPVLLANYEPTALSNDFLFLRKRAEVNQITEPSKLTSENHFLGDAITVPDIGRAVFAEVEIVPTFWGRLANIFLKTSQLHATFELEDGTKKSYRIISTMGKSGFVISPLIENTMEFGLLYAKNDYLDAKIVKSFSIQAEGGRNSLWSDEFSVTFKEVSFTTLVANLETYEIDHLAAELSNYNAATAEKCDGSIDSPIPEKLSSGLLSLNGWAVNSVGESTLPKAVYLVLVGDQGNRIYFKTRKVSRPDVGAYFKKPVLNESGYRVVADISALSGKHTLGLAIMQDNEIKICPQFKFPITFGN